ncbi:MAG TPA: hypothetical protein VK989_15750, partial [Polyangia bacterium]|nr:hypothetical protein [Polyangia bacterium]
MSRLASRLPFAILLLAACARGGAPAGDAGGAAGAEGGAPTAWNCQQIRMCALGDACADDACVARCAAHGSAAAQTTFEELRACTAKTCATGDITCACGEQCLADGHCLAEADACLGGATS